MPQSSVLRCGGSLAALAPAGVSDRDDSAVRNAYPDTVAVLLLLPSPVLVVTVDPSVALEPPRESRRLFCLSQATMADSPCWR